MSTQNVSSRDGDGISKQIIAGTGGAGQIVPKANITDESGIDISGVGGTGIIQPTGGSGILGWLSGVFNQTSGINNGIGAQADTVASTDTGTFSFISLFKRALQKMTSLVSTQTISIVTNQSVAIGAGNTQSATTNASTGRVILSATVDCWVLIGSNPTAIAHTTGSGFFLTAGATTYPISITGGTDKVAVVQDNGSGYLSIIEIS